MTTDRRYQILKVNPRVNGNLAMLFLAAEPYHKRIFPNEIKKTGGFTKEPMEELRTRLDTDLVMGFVVTEKEDKGLSPAGYALVTPYSHSFSPIIEEIDVLNKVPEDSSRIIRTGLVIECANQVMIKDEGRAFPKKPELFYIKIPRIEDLGTLGIYENLGFTKVADDGKFSWHSINFNNLI